MIERFGGVGVLQVGSWILPQDERVIALFEGFFSFFFFPDPGGG